MATNRTTRQYSDVNFLFNPHPATADVTKKFNEEAVKASVRSLISTRHYERPFHPEIGCQLHSLLFENFTPVTADIMRQTIIDVIEKFEPRVRIIDIGLTEKPDTNELVVDVVFRLINSERPITLRTAVSRVR